MKQASLGLVVAVGAASAAGYALAGPAFGIVGAGFGASAGALLAIMQRYGRHRAALTEQEVPDTSELTPHQRLAVLATAAAARQSDRPSLVVPLLDTLADIERQAERGEYELALGRARELQREKPANAAVARCIARLHMGRDELEPALEHAARAIRLAIRGCANPLAAQIFQEFRAHSEALALEPAEYEHLGRVLDAQGRETGAHWCRAQVMAVA